MKEKLFLFCMLALVTMGAVNAQEKKEENRQKIEAGKQKVKDKIEQLKEEKDA